MYQQPVTLVLLPPTLMQRSGPSSSPPPSSSAPSSSPPPSSSAPSSLFPPAPPDVSHPMPSLSRSNPCGSDPTTSKLSGMPGSSQFRPGGGGGIHTLGYEG